MKSLNPINVGLLGIGTVGGGTFERAGAQPGGNHAPRGARHRHPRGRRQGPEARAQQLVGKARQGHRRCVRGGAAIRTSTSWSN